MRSLRLDSRCIEYLVIVETSMIEISSRRITRRIFMTHVWNFLLILKPLRRWIFKYFELLPNRELYVWPRCLNIIIAYGIDYIIDYCTRRCVTRYNVACLYWRYSNVFWLLGTYPNTYVFTKCVAEDVCRNKGGDLPLVIFRPAIGKYSIIDMVDFGIKGDIFIILNADFTFSEARFGSEGKNWKKNWNLHVLKNISIHPFIVWKKKNNWWKPKMLTKNDIF